MTTPEPEEGLSDAKRRVSRKFLGKAGIHGVGVDASQQKVSVYRQAAPEEDSAETESLMAAAADEAGPFGVEVHEEEAPTITAPSGDADEEEAPTITASSGDADSDQAPTTGEGTGAAGPGQANVEADHEKRPPWWRR